MTLLQVPQVISTEELVTTRSHSVITIPMLLVFLLITLMEELEQIL